MSPLARLVGRRLPLASAFRRPRPLASAADVRFHSSRQHDILFGGAGVCGVDDGRRSHLPLRAGADSRPRFYSSSSVIRRGYSRLHVGFASLPDAPPLSSSSDESTTSDESSDIESDPQAAVVLASLRGGARSFDCPAPPSIVEGDTRHPSGAKGDATCWDANRDGETRLANALDRAREALKEDGEEGGGDGPVFVTFRLGYRSAIVVPPEADAVGNAAAREDDLAEREGRFQGDARAGLLFAGKKAEEDDDENDNPPSPAVALVHNLSEEYALHVLRSSPLVRRYKIDDKENGGREKENVKLISLAHNPETQIAAYLMSNHHQHATAADSTPLLQRARDHMKRRLASSFVGYEIAVRDGLIDGYGVDSNGLSLPRSHDMHLDWRDVLECAADAYADVHGEDGGNGGGASSSSSLRTIRLPGNVLETRGLEVAREVRAYLEGDDDDGSPSEDSRRDDPFSEQDGKLRKLRSVLPEDLDVCVTRPLTAYPYGGTGWGPDASPGLAENGGGAATTPPAFLNGQNDDAGSGNDGKNIDATHPIRILDYQIEAGHGAEAAPLWSNHHHTRYGPRPAAYQPILNAALSHFDADTILEASRERDLTVEERETLHGCKLLRDMLHDLDAGLDDVKSFAAYEEYLMNAAVPLIHGTFEELDEESARMLQLFFRVHGMAARMATARWTRDLLLAGRKGGGETPEDVEGGGVGRKDAGLERAIARVWKNLGFGDFAGGYDVPEDVTLQEFALRHLLKEDAVKSLVLGCSRPEHVVEALRVADSSMGDGERKP